MAALRPSHPHDPVALLRDAIYGFERDDTDGYVFAKYCVRLALAELELKEHNAPN